MKRTGYGRKSRLLHQLTEVMNLLKYDTFINNIIRVYNSAIDSLGRRNGAVNEFRNKSDTVVKKDDS